MLAKDLQLALNCLSFPSLEAKTFPLMNAARTWHCIGGVLAGDRSTFVHEILNRTTDSAHSIMLVVISYHDCLAERNRFLPTPGKEGFAVRSEHIYPLYIIEALILKLHLALRAIHRIHL